MCGGSTTSGFTSPSDTGVRRNSSNKNRPLRTYPTRCCQSNCRNGAVIPLHSLILWVYKKAGEQHHGQLDSRPQLFLSFLCGASGAYLVLTLTSIMVTGCATNGCESDPSSPVADAGYDSTAKVPEQSSNDVQQRTDLGNEYKSSWNRYEVISDTSVRFFFSMGNPECHGVRVTVDRPNGTPSMALADMTKVWNMPSRLP